MRKIILFLSLVIVACNKPNTTTTTTPVPITQHPDTTKAIDYSKFAVVKNSTAYSSSIDSISISDTIYHPFHTDSLFYINFAYNIWYDETNYYDIPTREKSNVKFYLTVGQYYNPIEVTVFQPDGSYLESTEVLKYPGKDSAIFKMPISNKIQVSLAHL